MGGWRARRGTAECVSGGRAGFPPPLGSRVGSASLESSLVIVLVMLAAEVIWDD